MTREPFGALRDGSEIELIVLRGAGLEVAIATYGAIVQRLLAPDRAGSNSDVVLGFPTLDEYVRASRSYVGAVMGRYANRIAGGRFVLDGVTHSLDRNEGTTSLHGGASGFWMRVWQTGAVGTGPGEAAVTLDYVSEDGEMGYPGTLSASVTYRLRDDRSIRIELAATTDRPTVANLTNHTYWNLAGEGSGTIGGHVLQVGAGRYVEVDAKMIPTGRLPAVAGTPLDLRRPVPLESRPALDLTYVLEPGTGEAPSRAAELHDPSTGRTLTVETTEPGIHVYTGEGLDGTAVGKSGRPYVRRTGIALETQHFPDSPNHPEFPTTTLRPGETLSSTTVWRLSV